ncbi:MAG: hypothetical protein OK474_06720 [Thaumarchaeota archaeon]|nr:hypothetical protein [Nitrososphaerota archaeon]
MATTEYRLTGRVRDEEHEDVEGLTVLAFARTPRILMRPDARLGTSTTGSEGCFEMAFSSAAFEEWLEREPDVYLEIRDREGSLVLTTSSRKNETGRIDLQIELGAVQGDPGQPDVYSGGIERMIEELKSAGDFADVSRDDVSVVLNLLLRTLGSYAFFTDQLFTLSGYDGIQVPRQPRRQGHQHVTRWDEAVLP